MCKNRIKSKSDYLEVKTCSALTPKEYSTHDAGEDSQNPFHPAGAFHSLSDGKLEESALLVFRDCMHTKLTEGMCHE